MDLTKKEYTDVLEGFIDWQDMFNVIFTMRHIGLPVAEINAREYLRLIDDAYKAKFLFPDMSLHEAYSLLIASSDEEVIKLRDQILSNSSRKEAQISAPCGGCGGGEVK